ncbi:MAG: hypothetical protein IB617_00870 [Candidatus Nealsonbacteria bacterium]|nr:MAG: hypothetical protein IB617_00870 [Candidatus Nealsonbacteria bacterium]
MKINPKKERKELPPEKVKETPEKLYIERETKIEKEKPLTEEERRRIKEKYEEEFRKMKLSPDMEEEAKEEAKQIKTLEKEGKINRLLNIAKEKGVYFAVKVAENMNDPYTLDILHDILAKDAFYKRFLKQ